MEFSEVGLLAGNNGDHCDYLVGHVRESDQSPEEIKGQYKGLGVAFVEPVGAGDNFVPVVVEIPGPEASGVLQYSLEAILLEVEAKRTRKTLYVVYAFDEGYDSDGDFRCY